MKRLKRTLLAMLLILVSQALIWPPELLLAQRRNDSGEAHPVIALQSDCLLGGTLKGKWLKAETILPMLAGDESYRLYNLTSQTSQATGARVESMGVPCEDTYKVRLSVPMHDSSAVIAVGGDWNALPRTPRQLSTNTPVYRQAVAALLRSKGIARPDVQIKSILSIDLEGDGQDEVLINATRYQGGLSPNSKPGDYSFVLLRKLVGGRVRNILVDGLFYPRGGTFNAPNEYTLSGVFDVDGDGIMEIVVESQYYEGGATTVYRASGNRVSAALVCGCGV